MCYKIIQNVLNNFLVHNEFFDLMFKLNSLFNQNLHFTLIKNWKLPNKKQLNQLILKNIVKKILMKKFFYKKIIKLLGFEFLPNI